MTDDATLTAVRLDKWLWAARFFKTRALAVTAIEGGKVHVDGAKAKPGRGVHLGNRLTIRRGHELFEVHVTGLSESRGPATVAMTLYQESEASLQARQQQQQDYRLGLLSRPVAGGRPTKKDRRDWQRHQGEL
ncbi:MAG: RNA-binding protein [Magnetococcales bacterium]|nr:RNA-binding protein [Magnetococcales bacterium]